eukprot:Phypoly_transcript_17809.p1 GENE.Phypoly_transcript_17809~~Phypoly_transcript_17809.p1  ORF type:complete len:145 (+),score=11.73 Phypoly_transcript_17809:26-436(+)
MGKKKNILVNGNAPSPVLRSISSPSGEKGVKQQSEEISGGGEHHHHGHNFREIFVSIICTILAVLLIQQCPLPSVDVKKQPNVSFLSMCILNDFLLIVYHKKKKCWLISIAVNMLTKKINKKNLIIQTNSRPLKYN